MNKIKWGIIGVLTLLCTSAPQTFAIEGLQVSVQCSNVVLSWPSIDGETYIVQCRQTLGTNSSWDTLTNYLLADSGTNWTFYVHSNVVQNPNCGSSSGLLAAATNGSSSFRLSVQSATKDILSENDTIVRPMLQLPPLPWETNTPTQSSETLFATGMRHTSLDGVSFTGDDFQLEDTGGSYGTMTAPDTGFYRVVRNGVHVFGLTNNVVLGGTVQYPIEIATDSDDEIGGISCYADGAPLIGATVERNAAGAWVLVWNTDMMRNGAFAINAEANFDTDASVAGSSVTVTVSNLVSFPNYFSRIFGDQMWIYAELAVLQADFEIKMYDDSDTYLGSFYGSTSDGIISFLWDLTDGNGYTFTNAGFRGEFDITPQNTLKAPHKTGGGSSSSGGKVTWAKEWNWSSCDNFVIAFGALSADPVSSYKIGRMIIGDIAGQGGGDAGVVNSLAEGGYTLSPGNVVGTSAFQVSDATTKTNLLGYLATFSYRNFYWFGHGNASGIAAWNNKATKISKSDIQNILGNSTTTPIPTNFQPYRLVFIHSCESGKSTLCEAFSIPAQTLNNAFFTTLGIRSRAFLGFKSNVGFNPSQWEWESIMLGRFFVEWSANTPLMTCVSNATQATFQPLESSWVIYGATDLTRGGP